MHTISRIAILIWILSQSIGITKAQYVPLSTYEIVLKSGDGTIRIWVSDEKKRIKVTPDHQYYGYYMNQLFCKQGEIEGKPLNGKYLRYDLKDNILESGEFKFGLKDGIWKQLSPEGFLTETKQFCHGELCGERVIYINGKPDTQEKYSNGKLIGKPLKLNPVVGGNNGNNATKKKENLVSHLLKPNKLKTPIQPDNNSVQKREVQ